MKYEVTFSCGHTAEVQIYGSAAEREKKIAYFEQYGECPSCYRKRKIEEETGEKVPDKEECVEKEMHYGEYKEHYSHCETKEGSYNKRTKTIIVYVPADEQ